MDGSPSPASRVRVAGLSAIAGLFAPLVFICVLVLRKVNRRAKRYTRHWNKRLENEIARWR